MAVRVNNAPIGATIDATNKIIDMLRLLGNCANKANYDYTEADVAKIFNTLEKELKAAKMKYMAMESEDEKFKL